MPTLIEIPPPDPTKVADALATTGAAVTDLIRRHGDDLARPVARLKWDANALVGHLIALTEVYADIVSGKGSAYDSLNPADIQRISDRMSAAAMARGGDPADAFAARVADLVAATAAADPTSTVLWHAATSTAPTRPAAGVVGEYLIHGHDLAKAFGEPWAMEPAHVELLLQGLAPMMPKFLSAKGARFTGTYQLRLRGYGTYTFVFADGALRVGGAWDGPVDCRTSAEPRAYALAAYTRIGPVRPALTGRMLVYGRKPWLGARFAALLQAP